MPKTVTRKIYELFEPENGNAKYTKAFCKEHSGEFVVYTGTTIGIFAKVDFADYTTPNLTFTTDGEKAGTIEYIRGDVPPLHCSNIKDIQVEVPVLSDGRYDLAAQTELAKKYQDIDNQKKLLVEKAEELKKYKILIDSDSQSNYVKVPITKLFTPKGGDMKLSKPYCKDHAGEYSVYSGSTSKEIFGSIDTYKYDGEYLTWVIDGLAGYVMKLTGKFSITCHRGILIPTKECKNVDLLYVKYMIEPIFRRRARGRIGINGKNEYTALKPTHIINYNDSILIPVDENGDYDLKKQQDLAMKYATIETIKENICDQIYNLTNIVVN